MTTPNNYIEPPQVGKRVIIRNLPPGTTREELHELGNKYGRVVNVELVPKPDRPFGFISFLSEDDAGFTIYRLNGYRYKTHILEVSLSNTKLAPKPKPTNKTKTDDKHKKPKKPLYSLRTLSPLNPPTPSPQQNKPSNDSHIIKSWDKHTLSLQTSSDQPDNGFPSPDNNQSANTGKAKRNNHNQQNSNYRKSDNQGIPDKIEPDEDEDNNAAAAGNNAPILEENSSPNDLDQGTFPVTEIQINIPPNQRWVNFKLGPEQVDQFLKAVEPFLQITELR